MPTTAVYSEPSSIPTPANSRRDHTMPRKISPIPRINETGYSPHTYLPAAHPFSNFVVSGSSTHGETTAFLSEELGKDHKQWMDPPNGHGLYFGIQEQATALGSSCSKGEAITQGSDSCPRRRDNSTVTEASNKETVTTVWHSGFLQQCICSPQEGRGGWRPIINIKHLNSFLEIPHFKMESIKRLKDVVLPGDYMVKLDLQDAYLTVPMYRSVCKYLHFCWKEEIYEFQSLPFGLAPAPLLFTKLLKPLLGFLRERGVRIIINLDDMLILAGGWRSS